MDVNAIDNVSRQMIANELFMPLSVECSNVYYTVLTLPYTVLYGVGSWIGSPSRSPRGLSFFS